MVSTTHTTRIRPLEGREAPLLARLMGWASRRMYGKEMRPVQVLAHAPRLLLPSIVMQQFAGGKSRLSPAVRALAMHLAAERNGCAWCLDFGAFVGPKQGATPDQLAAVGNYAANPFFSPAERAALAFADEMTRNGGHVADDTFATLRAHFSEREIVELAVAVAAENFFNLANAALGVEAQGFCALPTRATGARAHAHSHAG